MMSKGKWVFDADMHPLTNIAGRRWRAIDGSAEGIYYGQGSFPSHINRRSLMWFFPEEQAANK
jgi:hypothetical protein